MARRTAILVGLVSTCCMLMAEPAFAADPCDGILAFAGGVKRERRPILPLDLARLRDIGPSIGSSLPTSPLSVSPDAKTVAFILSRADPDSNDYCQALVLMDLRAGGEPRLLDRARGQIISRNWLRGARSTSGSAIVNKPVWSPDGTHIAYLALDKETVQARLVSFDAGNAMTVTGSRSDVRSLGWSDEKTLLFSHEPRVEAAEDRLRSDGRRGYLYDDLFVPNASVKPSVAGPLPLSVRAVDVATLTERLASTDEQRELTSSASPPIKNALLFAQAPNGTQAWTTARDAAHINSSIILMIQKPGAPAQSCTDAACTTGVRGFEGLWWSSDGRALIFLQRGGWGESALNLYRRTDRRSARLIMSTDDLLTGCTMIKDQLLCARESSTRPRRLVFIDTRSGRETELFNPNPEFSSMDLGKVERLHWMTADSIECFGDLVLPPGHDGKTPLPTIVVQYFSRGFLRGGVGDEYPIYPLAAQGFAILSFHRPPDYHESKAAGPLKTFTEALRADTQDWTDRRRVNAALMSGLDRLVERGIADPRRLGITGLSDGATSTQFALVNGPRRFAAAAVSTGFMEPVSTQIYGGSAWAKQLTSFGYPTIDQDGTGFWSSISIGLNAPMITAPILMQVADDEYLTALESHAALKAHRRPVELYVFPQEHHIKQQPAHRLAIYHRVIDWFRFWLMDARDDQPDQRDQYRRWEALREESEALSPNSVPTVRIQASTSASVSNR